MGTLHRAVTIKVHTAYTLPLSLFIRSVPSSFTLFLSFLHPVSRVWLLWHVRQDPAVPPQLERREHSTEVDLGRRHPWRRSHWGGALWYVSWTLTVTCWCTVIISDERFLDTDFLQHLTWGVQKLNCYFASLWKKRKHLLHKPLLPAVPVV